ncbi:DnaA N-terminal domain-containing protein [Pseudooceanicola sp. MF1-13]|uniref:DnaA N-terminal domain-containing protein n=1 Tax=Pseudooceanicola sp. MF1-13 TaxID=3379095 RepID=UPI0038928DA3
MQAGAGDPFGARKQSTGTKLTGPGAAALKYDILTALLVSAARGTPDQARLATRLSLLITARFNWRTESFAIGLREIARMWGVTERTAKRDMAAMRAKGWIDVTIPAARGRVAQYAIRFDTVLRETMPFWEAVGPDFAARMAGVNAPEADTVPDNVVPLRPVAAGQGGDYPAWALAAEKLAAQDPAVFNAWFAGLIPVEGDNGILTLMAPSRFVADYLRTHYYMRLLTAVVSADPAIRDIDVIWSGEGRA